MKRSRIVWKILKQTHADRLLISYVAFFFVMAWIIQMLEPGIHSYSDSLWYCFAAMTTIGFGDIEVTNDFARICTVILSVYSIVLIAILTAVITNYYIELVKIRANESMMLFLDQLERLPELSKEELEDLSKRVRKFNKR